VKIRIEEIVSLLRFGHINLESLHCVRSRGSQAKRTIARIHGRGKIWQVIGLPPAYVIEIIAERFDRLTNEDQDKTLIHELLHIPHGFKGGFRHHRNYVNDETVETWYRRLCEKREE
jgi:predicted metallopeptidase